MAENSGISWTDHTFNPWMGCTKVSPACKNCYAERDMDKRYRKVAWGPSGTRVLTSDDNWKKPLRWNREAGEKGIRYRVFCASLADVFEDWNGPIHDNKGSELRISEDGRITDCVDWTHPLTMADVRSRLFRLIDHTPNLDWLLLTKRPQNIGAMWPIHPSGIHQESISVRDAYRRDNVWVGTSVENADYLPRIDSLKSAGDLVRVLFLSLEPLLGSLPTLGEHLDGIDWVIAGGESGPDARPSHPDWFRSVRDQCEALEIPFHFKQWGEWGLQSDIPAKIGPKDFGVLSPSGTWYESHTGWNGRAIDEDTGEACMKRYGVNQIGRLLDGVLHDGFPDPISVGP